MKLPFAALILIAALLPVAALADEGKSLTTVLAAPNWLQGRPSAASLHGKVVIVDVFTFDCINCKHVVPELRKLHAAYAGRDLQIIGVHAPETPYERDRAHIMSALVAQGITWPIALDPDFTIWHAFSNEYWPTQYIFDRRGTLRAAVVGEGDDARVARTVKSLVAEAG